MQVNSKPQLISRELSGTSVCTGNYTRKTRTNTTNTTADCRELALNTASRQCVLPLNYTHISLGAARFELAFHHLLWLYAHPVHCSIWLPFT